jgi:YjjG family noncanonical pyrimidine nucleotidase
MYKCIFFDLDHTLWDYEKNSEEALRDLHINFKLASYNIDFTLFHSTFREVNLKLWDLYDNGHITSDVIRKERFKQILNTFYVDDEQLSLKLSDHYLDICPDKGNLIPHAVEVLQYLASKYRLSIITNGFEEIQHRKLKAGNLSQFFDHIVTSQRSGHRKPAREIFEYALQFGQVAADDALMIGDNLLTDIAGARNASVDSVFLNRDSVSHQEVIKYEINCLSELYSIL